MKPNELDKKLFKEYVTTQSFKTDLKSIENCLFELNFMDSEDIKELLREKPHIYIFRNFRELSKKYEYDPIYPMNEKNITQLYKDLYKVIINCYINSLYNIRDLVLRNL